MKTRLLVIQLLKEHQRCMTRKTDCTIIITRVDLIDDILSRIIC